MNFKVVWQQTLRIHYRTNLLFVHDRGGIDKEINEVRMQYELNRSVCIPHQLPNG